MRKQGANPFNIIVIVAALGYFVDIYDLILFQVVKNPSLESLGLSGKELTDTGLSLMSWQMTGMLIGGILWGILGDKRGRLSVLFGSIILYSVANLFNGFVDSISGYACLRLVAGIGLAGELGAGITLVAETMTKENRGYGTMLVVSFGVLGAVAANLVNLQGGNIAQWVNGWAGRTFQPWQITYFIGGILGIFLLILRLGVYESGMYKSIKEARVKKGSFKMLFTSRGMFKKYMCCIGIGVPIWYMIGILIALAKDINAAKGLTGINTGNAVMYFYIGTSFGDFMGGYLSQIFRNRKKIVLFYLFLTCTCVPFYLFITGITAAEFYLICGILGIAAGYWAVFVTIASEQFGTNIRSTVTTTVPNMVRASLVILTLLIGFFQNSLHFNIIISALLVGVISIGIAFASLVGLNETFGKELNYVEELN